MRPTVHCTALHSRNAAAGWLTAIASKLMGGAWHSGARSVSAMELTEPATSEFKRLHRAVSEWDLRSLRRMACPRRALLMAADGDDCETRPITSLAASAKELRQIHPGAHERHRLRFVMRREGMLRIASQLWMFTSDELPRPHDHLTQSLPDSDALRSKAASSIVGSPN